MLPSGGGSYNPQSGGGYLPQAPPSTHPPQYQQHQQIMMTTGGGSYHHQQPFPNQPPQQMMMTQAPSSMPMGGGGMTLASSTPSQPPFQVRAPVPTAGPMPTHMGMVGPQQNQPQHLAYTTAYQQQQPQMITPNYSSAPASQGVPSGQGGQQQQGQASAHQTQQTQVVFDPVGKARNLIQKDLRNSLMGLMKTANELMKLKAQTFAEQEVPPSGNADESDTTPSGGSSQQQPAEQDVKPPRRSRSPTHMAYQVQKCLEQFYAVCDQLEYQFLLIQETQRQSKVGEKNIPLKMKTEESPQGTVTFGQYKKVAEDQIRHAANVQAALETCIKQLSEIYNPQTEADIADNKRDTKKIKLDNDENHE